MPEHPKIKIDRKWRGFCNSIRIFIAIYTTASINSLRRAALVATDYSRQANFTYFSANAPHALIQRFH